MGASVVAGRIAFLGRAFAASLALATGISVVGLARGQPAEEKKVTTGPAPALPLPPPRADEQEPRPYLRAPDPERPLRSLELGPDFGVAVRPSNRDSVSYGAAVAIGGHALIELTRWLGFRALFARSDVPVTIDRGEFGLRNTDVHQPDLDLTMIAGRFEPTWVVSPRLRLWVGAGAGLAYFRAPVARSTGELQIQTARRGGVAVDIGGALGGTFEVIPDWFTAALSGSAAFTTGQTGDAFAPVQSFDATGHRYYAAGLPEFAGSFGATASLGLLL